MGSCTAVQEYMDADETVEEFTFLIGHVNNIPLRLCHGLDYYRNSI